MGRVYANTCAERLSIKAQYVQSNVYEPPTCRMHIGKSKHLDKSHTVECRPTEGKQKNCLPEKTRLVKIRL